MVVVKLLLLVLEVVVVTRLSRHLPSLYSERGGRQTGLETQLVHPVDHSLPAVSYTASSCSVLSQTGLQSLLELPAKLLPVRAEVEEVVALLHRHPLLLG